MKVNVTDVSAVKKTVEVVVDPEEVARERESVALRFAKHARIPGFRPGKAPLAVVEKRFAGEIKDDVRDHLIAHAYEHAIEERKLRPVGNPSVEELKFEDGEPFSFKTTFEIYPELEPKGYKEVEVRRPKPRVGDDDVDKFLDDLRQAHAQLEAREGKAAEDGDVLRTHVEGTPEGGEPFRRENALLEVGGKDNLPAFDEHLRGAKAGETLEFTVTYPDDYPAEALAGKPATYKIEVLEVKERKVPELDDEFAKDLGEFDDLAELRAKVREDLEARKAHEIDRQVRNDVIDKVLLENPVPLPETLVESELRGQLEDMARQMIMRGVDPRKAEVDWDKLREQQTEPARKAVHARLVLDAVAEAEGIVVSPREVDERLRIEAARAGEKYEDVRRRATEGGILETLKNQMVREKSLDYLTSVANILEEE